MGSVKNSSVFSPQFIKKIIFGAQLLRFLNQIRGFNVNLYFTIAFFVSVMYIKLKFDTAI